MILSSPTKEYNNGEVFVRFSLISDLDYPKTLWYSLPEEFDALITDNCDPAIVALLIPLMQNGENVVIEGKISEKLNYSLQRPYQKIIQKVVGGLNRIKIEPDEITDVDAGAQQIATGFSGGVDSFSVLADHFFGNVPPGYKVNTLIYYNVGSHGLGKEALFRRRFADLFPVAENMGLPMIAVNSNVDDFYNLKHQQTHTPRSSSVALLLQNGIKRYLYAASYPYEKVFIGNANDTAYSDLVSLPLLSTESIDILSTGSEYTRVEKTVQTASIEHSYNALDVCVNYKHDGNPKNCSNCGKCLRTLLTLEITGHLEKYEAQFDLSVYRRVRSRFIHTVYGSDDIFHKEIAAFGKEHHFPFPLTAKIKAKLRKLKFESKRG